PRPPKNYRFTYGATAISKDGGSPTDDGHFLSSQAGEDSFYMRGDSLGVADGVGGWSVVPGANPAMYSRKIMHHLHEQLERQDDFASLEYESSTILNPRKLLRTSLRIVSSDPRLVGSTTVLFVVLRNDELHIANLGDCGLMLVRGGELVFRTEEQQHSFNFPFQLGTDSTDSPADAQVYRLKVKPGDLIILGTDGFYDNVFDEEILNIIRQHWYHQLEDAGNDIHLAQLDPQKLTDALAKRAREVAEDSKATNSPFQTRAVEEGLYYQGGKLDDITIVAGVIV
ncbi:hypothetical protein HK096_001407, partial [Nowakowskiella sp. JEL0078]